MHDCARCGDLIEPIESIEDTECRYYCRECWDRYYADGGGGLCGNQERMNLLMYGPPP